MRNRAAEASRTVKAGGLRSSCVQARGRVGDNTTGTELESGDAVIRGDGMRGLAVRLHHDATAKRISGAMRNDTVGRDRNAIASAQARNGALAHHTIRSGTDCGAIRGRRDVIDDGIVADSDPDAVPAYDVSVKDANVAVRARDSARNRRRTSPNDAEAIEVDRDVVGLNEDAALISYSIHIAAQVVGTRCANDVQVTRVVSRKRKHIRAFLPGDRDMLVELVQSLHCWRGGTRRSKATLSEGELLEKDESRGGGRD